MPASARPLTACLSTWYPRLLQAEVPTPKTVIVDGAPDLLPLLDGEMPEGFSAFLDRLGGAVHQFGYPVFLRTGHTAAKHAWARTCYVASRAELPCHLISLVEESACLDLCGLPTDVWVVREFLDLAARFHAFNGMPVARERRVFLENGQVLCQHPYWPAAAVRNPDSRSWRRHLAALNAESAEEIRTLTDLSARVAAHFEGAWSLDWALGRNGTYYAIDMAPASRSYHWPACAHANRWRTRDG